MGERAGCSDPEDAAGGSGEKESQRQDRIQNKGLRG